MLKIVVTFLCAFILGRPIDSSISYNPALSETLLIRPLENGKFLTHFWFQIANHQVKKPIGAPQLENYDMFPKSIGQLWEKFGIKEFHLSLTKGRWLEVFGIPVAPAPVGAELWVYISGKNSTSINSQWVGFQEGLAGMFCSSLNQIKEIQTSIPRLMFELHGSAFIKDSNASFESRYGSLPRENLCTENLTPWLKLLPCGKYAGLGMLLNPVNAFDTHYQSMQIHIVLVCIRRNQEGACIKRSWRLTLSFSLVLEPHISSRESVLSIQQLFGVESVEFCPIASESTLFLQLTAVNDKFLEEFSFSPPTIHELPDLNNLDAGISHSPAHVHIYSRHRLLEYDLMKFEKLAFTFTWNGLSFASLPGGNISVIPLKFQRYFTGEGQHFGGVSAQVINSDETRTFEVTYVDAYPWYMKIYCHTLKLWLNGRIINHLKDISGFHYKPADYRSTPSLIELQVIIPPKSTLIMAFQFEKSFLTIDEFPPDYNRGFDIAASAITVLNFFDDFHVELNHQNSRLIAEEVNTPVRVYMTQLLLLLPSPDMSMPFNVIAFSCTVLAFFFGSLFNILYKSVKEQEKRTTSTRLHRLGQRLQQHMRKIRDKYRRAS